MTILLLGGRGKTSSRIASLLAEAGKPFLVASRSTLDTYPHKQCQFDWIDEQTYGNPFIQAGDIGAVYLVAPPVLDLFSPMKRFIDFAREKGVTRFVLLSASILEKGGPAMGAVHAYLAGSGVEYTVLRPSWFMG